MKPYPKYKDSGVEWIGEMPEGWDIFKARYLFSRITSGPRGWAQYYSDDGDIFLRIANLSSESISLPDTF